MHLKELAALLIDSVNGYKLAAQKIADEKTKRLFENNESLSLAMLKELDEEIKRLGGETLNHGTLKGAVNHLWMKLKAEVNDNDIKSFLKNIVFCEEFNIDRYNQVIPEIASPGLQNLLKKQLDILENRTRLLKEMYPGS